jgi:hypothetical protein
MLSQLRAYGHYMHECMYALLFQVVQNGGILALLIEYIDATLAYSNVYGYTEPTAKVIHIEKIIIAYHCTNK